MIRVSVASIINYGSATTESMKAVNNTNPKVIPLTTMKIIVMCRLVFRKLLSVLSLRIMNCGTRMNIMETGIQERSSTR